MGGGRAAWHRRDELAALPLEERTSSHLRSVPKTSAVSWVRPAAPAPASGRVSLVVPTGDAPTAGPVADSAVRSGKILGALRWGLGRSRYRASCASHSCGIGIIPSTSRRG